MTTITALSSSKAVNELMLGSQRGGVAIARQHLKVGEYVFTLTRPWDHRMPNGVEADISLEDGDPVVVGGGCLRAGNTRILPGVAWNPRPRVRYIPVMSRAPHLNYEQLVGWGGTGLIPLGDEIICGYLAGVALFGLARSSFVYRDHATSDLSRTLIRHAADGELPEPAHRLLSRGSCDPLITWDSGSGAALSLGLAMAGSQFVEELIGPLRLARGGGDSFDITVQTPSGLGHHTIVLVPFELPRRSPLLGALVVDPI